MYLFYRTGLLHFHPLPHPCPSLGTVQTKDFLFCLVDEADSILIDEARTPLIISRSVDAPAQKFATAQKIANVLEKGLHYTVSRQLSSRSACSASF